MRLSRSSRDVTRRRVTPTTRAAITAPEPEQSTAGVWRRIVDDGQAHASELWASVNSAAAAAAKGTWEGIKPVKKVLWSDVLYSPKREAFLRKWMPTDITYASFIGAMHAGCLLAPFTFTWSAFNCFLVMYFITGCLGITLSYHRQLSHKSFTTPKWLEYALAYCGAMAVQGDPLEWASSHRHHHQHCDTPKDPHTPYEGFWWSHCGWLLDNEATLKRVGDRSNAKELAEQPFYQFMEKTYMWHVLAWALAFYAIGGLPWLVWGFCVRTCWVYHITWAVNSVAHVWGSQTFNTGDLSRNNWWIGVLAFGEGWHNNHHAFEFSARHGLEWWQIDMTWWCVCVLKFLGLADKVKLPSEKQMDRIRIQAA
jgi:stearoyl-CoA desaturase (Delta-9 desaturase)